MKNKTIVIPKWMLMKTFAVQHNPNCPSPFLVRLVRPGTGYLDFKQYISVGTHKDPSNAILTHDILGFGTTLQEAAEAARTEWEKAKKEANK